MVWPVIACEPLVLPTSLKDEADLWETLIELTKLRLGEWTLIGGLMVFLHALEHGETPPRVSTDIDVLINTRIVSNSIPKFTRGLEQRGFKLTGISPEGVAHRYHRRGVGVDVLAPDGLGLRANLSTSSSGYTVQVPGGTQALQRTELVPVIAGGIAGYVPRPSLLGAIICKAGAVLVDDVPDAQRQDLAFLLSLVDDPQTLRSEMSSGDRRRLVARHELNDMSNPAWAMLDMEAQDQGRAALRLLTTET